MKKQGTKQMENQPVTIIRDGVVLAQDVILESLSMEGTTDILKAPEDALYCAICRALIPEKRRTRNTATCSEKCKNKLDTIRANQRKARKCPHCLHPATPEEREAFRIWRAERGDIRSANQVKRDSTLMPKNEMREGLKTAVRLAQAELEWLGAWKVAHGLNSIADATNDTETAEFEYAEKRIGLLTTFVSRAEYLITPRPS